MGKGCLGGCDECWEIFIQDFIKYPFHFALLSFSLHSHKIPSLTLFQPTYKWQLVIGEKIHLIKNLLSLIFSFSYLSLILDLKKKITINFRVILSSISFSHINLKYLSFFIHPTSTISATLFLLSSSIILYMWNRMHRCVEKMSVREIFTKSH